MIRIPKLFVGLFLGRTKECIWCTLFVTLWALWTHVQPINTSGIQASVTVLSVHPLYVCSPCHLFDIYFKKQWCLTKVQKDCCVSLCSFLGASYPISFAKSMSWNRPALLSQIARVSTKLLSIRSFTPSWNKCDGILKMPYHLNDYTHDTHAYTFMLLFPVSCSDQIFTW